MYLYGASGHAKVIKEILEANGQRVEAFVDDNQDIHQFCGLPVMHQAADLSPFIVSIGDNSSRKRVVEQLHSTFSIAFHPRSVVSGSASIGEGSVVMAGAIINAESKIGNHCIINTGASVDHECVVDDFVHVSPHATLCGNVHVGEGS